MGYFLLRESMFDSVICVRDHWLEPTGVMYPSHACMWVGPCRSGLGDQKKHNYEGTMDDWYSFLTETKSYCGVDMSALTKPFFEEPKKYYLQTSLWSNIHTGQVIGTAAVVREIDCSTATVDDICEVQSKFVLSITRESTKLCGFSGWFDVHFRVFLMHSPVHVSEGDDLNVSFSMTHLNENHRLMEVELRCEIRQSACQMLPPFRNKFYIE